MIPIQSYINKNGGETWIDGELRPVEFQGKPMLRCQNGGIWDPERGEWVKGPDGYTLTDQVAWMKAMTSLDRTLMGVTEILRNA